MATLESEFDPLLEQFNTLEAEVRLRAVKQQQPQCPHLEREVLRELGGRSWELCLHCHTVVTHP